MGKITGTVIAYDKTKPWEISKRQIVDKKNNWYYRIIRWILLLPIRIFFWITIRLFLLVIGLSSFLGVTTTLTPPVVPEVVRGRRKTAEEREEELGIETHQVEARHTVEEMKIMIENWSSLVEQDIKDAVDVIKDYSFTIDGVTVHYHRDPKDRGPFQLKKAHVKKGEHHIYFKPVVLEQLDNGTYTKSSYDKILSWKNDVEEELRKYFKKKKFSEKTLNKELSNGYSAIKATIEEYFNLVEPFSYSKSEGRVPMKTEDFDAVLKQIDTLKHLEG